MRLSNVVWLLWGWRLLAVNILLYPVADHFKDTLKYTSHLLLFVDLVMIVMLVLKYKFTQLNLENHRLTLSQGFIFRRKVCIKLSRTCALRKISTPLCQKFGICNLIIYCEGVKFILPPLKNHIAASIEKECRKR